METGQPPGPRTRSPEVASEAREEANKVKAVQREKARTALEGLERQNRERLDLLEKVEAEEIIYSQTVGQVEELNDLRSELQSEVRDHILGSFLQNIRAAFNEHEGRQQSEHTKRGLRHAASQGYYMSPLAPYGFRKVPVEDGGRRHFTLELDPETSPIVQRIYEMLLNESSERATAEELNRDQIPSPNGGRWTPQQVGRIRRNAVNCGTYIYGRKDTDPIRVPGAFPAIVTEEVFHRVNEMMEGRRREAQKPPRMSPLRRSSKA